MQNPDCTREGEQRNGTPPLRTTWRKVRMLAAVRGFSGIVFGGALQDVRRPGWLHMGGETLSNRIKGVSCGCAVNSWCRTACRFSVPYQAEH